MIKDNQIGKVIKSYELEDLIGTGGFGAVYRARQSVVEREVAIKVIWPAFANRPNFIKRFEAEAQLIASLEHPHIVPLYDYWRDPEGAYIVMRWIRGGNLREHLSNRRWTIRDVDGLLGQIAAALAFAHRYGIVHRDIKPENILIDAEQNAYLADFGIAQILRHARVDEEFFGSMGSPAYAAPEQLAGEGVSAQSDIYSLGIILFELLTGRHPFPDLENYAMTQLLTFRKTAQIPLARTYKSDLPPALDEVLQRATAIAPEARYPNALELARAFQRAMGFGNRLIIGREQNTPPPVEIVANPYIGLRSFQENDAPNFFGREALVHRLVTRMREDTPFARFLAVVGPSGSGKSSVVKAGLMPALRRGALLDSETWFYCELVPGHQPFKELANTLISVASNPPYDLEATLKASIMGLNNAVHQILPADDSELVIGIDQFEEIFTLSEDTTDVSLFLKSLHHAVTAPNSRVRVIITIRADFYDRPLLQPGFSDLMREQTEVVIPMTHVELERVIMEPARRIGVVIESGLVPAIINSVKEQMGALPLLQYALSQLFDRREGNLITAKAYQEIGGVRGALARQADQLYDTLGKHQREVLRQLMLRLIAPGDGTEDTRRRVLLSELINLGARLSFNIDEQTIQSVIDALLQSRLLTFDRDPITRSPTVEVTHEALIREWRQLRSWLDNSRQDVRMQRVLSTLTQDWLTANMDVSFLLRGGRLTKFEEWATTTDLSLTQQEYEFIQASVMERDRREIEEQQRRAKEARLMRLSVQRMRLLIIVLAIASVLAIGLATFAFDRQHVAQRQAEQSQSLAWEAGARRALSEGNGDLALILALAANSMENPPSQSWGTLAETAFNIGTRSVLTGHETWVNSVDISPDSRLIASGSSDATVRLWDIKTGTLLHILSGHAGDVETVAFSPDSTKIVSGATDFSAIVWDVNTGSELQRLSGLTSPIRTLSVSPDGQIVATGSRDGLLTLWNIETGTVIRQISAHQSAVQTLVFTPDGNLIVTGARDGHIRIWDAQTGTQVMSLDGHQTGITGLDIALDQKQLVSAGTDGNIYLWDIATGQQAGSLSGAVGEIRAVRFSADGRSIYGASSVNLLQIWDVQSQSLLTSQQGHTDSVLAVDVSADNQYAVTGAKDGTLRVWNAGIPAMVNNAQFQESRITDVIATSEDQLYIASADSTLIRWDLSNDTAHVVFDWDENPILALSITPDHQRALIGTRDGLIALIDLIEGDIINRFDGHTSNIQDIIIASDGQRAVSVSSDSTAIVWNMTTGERLKQFTEHQSPLTAVAISHDGKIIATADRDHHVIVWETETDVIRYRLDDHSESIYSIDISADGRYLLTGSRDSSVRVYDLTTGTERYTFVSAGSVVWDAQFSANGQEIIVGYSDGRTVIYDIESQGTIGVYQQGKAPAFAVTFMPSGRFVISGYEDGQVTIWRAYDVDTLRAWVDNNRYLRPPTCAEQLQYHLTTDCKIS